MIIYKKAPYLTVGIQNKNLYVGFGSIQKVEKEEGKQSTILKLLDYFTEKSDWISAKKKFGFEYKYEESKDFIQGGNFLIPHGRYDVNDRFSRANLYFNMYGVNPAKAQEALSNSHIGIIGCGGIGNLVSANLATGGVGEITFCDDDQVEASNLSRQIMFSEKEIGRRKSECLAEAIQSRASHTVTNLINKKIFSIEDLNEFKKCDLLVVSADKGDVVNTVNRFSIKNNIPYINVGYVNDISVWGPFVIPGKTGCYACQNIVAGKSKKESINQLIRNINKDYQAPSVGPINMLSSSLASIDIVRFLIGEGEIKSLNRRVGLWTHDMRFEYQDCSKNINCRVCS